MKLREKIQEDTVTNNIIAGLAHELRNPLANINLSVTMLEDQTEMEMFPYLDIIKRNTARINELIKGIINYHNFLNDTRVPTSLHQILTEVLTLVDDRLKLRHISVNKIEHTACMMMCNRERMRIALTNIVINAIEAMTQEDRFLSIQTAIVNGKHVLTITDSGCGMNLDQLKNMYTPYYSNKKGGLGLGLSITKRILKENEISMEVESHAGFGTKFALTINSLKPYWGQTSRQGPWLSQSNFIETIKMENC